jgi:hypothetical protein
MYIHVYANKEIKIVHSDDGMQIEWAAIMPIHFFFFFRLKMLSSLNLAYF